jgi:hypothetical protein
VVKLSDEERERLNTLIVLGCHPGLHLFSQQSPSPLLASSAPSRAFADEPTQKVDANSTRPTPGHPRAADKSGAEAGTARRSRL